ncbi:FAD dependent oxidoreductase [Diplogelasinospora grovesii]|uniref:FAD dependent oxidoreductase n=1 Tax=Diplogelasinospora grovesii TaxID=303347 RepID=A0AAN6NG96_9PEZI|nr:FAD dependent oxidoreductase [Diplogelasinospora grovesii]
MTIREVAGLPSPADQATRSYWHKEPSERLLGHRTTADLPATADTVIVGSGITGAFAAHFLLNSSKEDAAAGGVMMMLEAREVCWGATGRNGGHCQPVVYASPPSVSTFELEVFHFLENFVGENNIPCDWVSLKGGGVHAFLSDDLFQVARAAVAQLKQHHPQLGAQIQVVGPPKTEGKGEQQGEGKGGVTLEDLRIPDVSGAIVQKHAASLWPYKLICWVLGDLLDRFPGFNLQTNTPVTNLRRLKEEGGQGGWVLTTPRGKITARNVLLATNGYTSSLLPAFADLIVPVRGQLGSLLPPRGQDDSPAKLDHAYVFLANYNSSDPKLATAPVPASRDDYVVQRPLPGGEMIYGGGRNHARNLAVGEWRDDEVEEEVARYLRGNLSPPLNLTTRDQGTGGGGKGEEGGGELKASFEWTGIMGFSRDHHPWVGAVPENLGGGEGLWICAGYTGHGMPVAALAARDVVNQMLGNKQTEGEGVGVPTEFRLTEERVRNVRETTQTVQDQKGDIAELFSLKLFLEEGGLD